jgi:hypothetical protein
MGTESYILPFPIQSCIYFIVKEENKQRRAQKQKASMKGRVMLRILLQYSFDELIVK